jgi:hypothetical protein
MIIVHLWKRQQMGYYIKSFCARFDGWQCLDEDEHYYISSYFCDDKAIRSNRSIDISEHNIKTFSKTIKDCI